MRSIKIGTVALMAIGASAQCNQTATSGCLNGVSYEYSSQFPCGSTMSNGNAPIYYNSTSGCCAQGIILIFISLYAHLNLLFRTSFFFV